MKKLTIFIVFCLNLLPYMSDGKWQIGSGSEALAQNWGGEEICTDDLTGYQWASWNGCNDAEVCACQSCGQQVECGNHSCTPDCYCPICHTYYYCTKGHICDGPGGDPGDGDPGDPGGSGGGGGWVPNWTYDCAGVWGGTAYIDYCGECVGGNTGKQACVKDCNNVWGGKAYIDNCAQCVGGTTGKQPCVKDCNNAWGGTAYIDDCGECVGGNTGQQPCDCAGVAGGSAYIRTCNGVTYCLDGNQGVFDNQLTGALLSQFNTSINDMLLNCLRAALLNNLKSDYGLNISAANGDPGTFNPCDYSIKFDPNEIINVTALSAELFHAYQEQFLDGKLSQIKFDEANDHLGGSNIEFEEKAMGILAGKFTGGGNYPGTTKLMQWIDDFLSNHPIHSNVVLTPSEEASWFEALEEFRTHYANNPQPGGFFYDKPIDYNMLPASLLNLWSLSDCEY